MEGGTIKGCTAKKGSSGGVLNRREFTMRGGRIGEDKTDESHVYNAADTAAVFTISGTAKIYTNVANDSRLNADGGEIFGDVTNAVDSEYGAVIAGTEEAADSTKFSGAVTNNETGTIAGGTFTHTVTNNVNTVTNNGGTILGGDFSKASLSGQLVITFEPNNGGISSKRKVNWSTDGATLLVPTPEPTKEGHTFEGWYYDNNGKNTKWDFDKDKAKYTMTLTAQWKANTSSSGGGGGGGTTYYTLTFETNGGGSMQAIRAARGKTLDLSAYTPMRDGYDFGGWYADKDLTQRITEIKLSGSKTVYADWKKREPDAVKNPFADVNAGDWFYQDVLFSYEKGLMSGMDAAAFAPYANTTRAQIAVIFYRMEGSPAVEGENSFADVVRGSGTAWFYDAVTWAQQNGIMGGYDNSSFAPNDPITREQLAAIFYRYAQYKGYDTTQGGMAIREFGDYESISDYAMGAMAWAVNTGLVKGDSNLLYPNGTATRAEIAAMLHRFVENGMK